MSTEEKHLDQAEHNTAFLQVIDKLRYPDWVVTVAFYTALHYLDAFLARKSVIDPGTHENRERFAKTFAELRRVVGPYMRLKSASIRTRYYGDKMSPHEIDALTGASLEHIKGHIFKLLQQK